MTRARLAAAAITVGCGAAVALLLLRPLGFGRAPAGGNVGGEGAVVVAPSPTPTPPPWLGSVVAAVVPDGNARAIALYEVGSEGAPRKLVDGFSEIDGLAWSPDGGDLAFAARRDGNWDLFRIARDGGTPERLTDHPAFDAGPAWSPDGRHLAFTSYREGTLNVYRLAVDGANPEPQEAVTTGDAPSIEPAWSPDGAWIAFSTWHDGAYRVEAVRVPSDGSEDDVRRVLADGSGDADLRAPKWAPDGRSIGYVEWRHGPGRFVTLDQEPETVPISQDAASRLPAPATGVGSGVRAFDWLPGGDVALLMLDDRGAQQLEVWDRSGDGRQHVGALPAGAADIAWTVGPMPPTLPDVAPSGATLASPADERPPMGASARDGGRPAGLADLADVRVPGARIHADLADDFAAMRQEVHAAVGADFLGTLSDLWRPLGFTGSSFFSWHKLGRAFDTQMELRGPGGRRDMVLVRDDARGRTMWRMFLRAATQDGTNGQPLLEPGWTFAAGSGDPELAREGGRRGTNVPEGYWVDFTSVAERHGWQRIPSITRGDLDWHRNWSGIDYWHYERRDGLRWFDAARQVYPEDHLVAELRAERLLERGVPLGRLTWLGFPSGWLSEG